MHEFSVWHWLIVAVIVVVVWVPLVRCAGRSSSVAGNYVHSVSKNLAAAMHLGALAPQQVLDRLEDVHRATLPELGVDTELLRQQAQRAKNWRRLVSAAQLIPGIWLLSILSDLNGVSYDYLSPLDFIASLLKPLLLSALICVIETQRTNALIRHDLIAAPDGSSNGNMPAENVVVFGGFSPFAGFGIDLEGWSFTVDTRAPRMEGEVPAAVDQRELLDEIASVLHGNVAGTVADRLYVNGQKIRSDSRFLPDKLGLPVKQVDPSVLDGFLGKVDGVARHYRSLTVPLSDGHMHLSFFFRSTMLGNNLFIESRTFILPPLRPELAPLVHMPARRGVRYVALLALQKFFASPLSIWRGFGVLIELVGRAQAKFMWALLGHPEDKRKRREETYNYGHSQSLREEAASAAFQTYFQVLDKDMTTKSYQSLIINTIVAVLDRKGICTDEIKERRTQIFNSGVIVSGGTVNANQLAVGTGATLTSKVGKALKATAKQA